MSTYLAVDIGTSRTKGALIDRNGYMLFESSIAHDRFSPKPGWHEHRAELQWWGDFIYVVRQILGYVSSNDLDISCLCISGMWPTFCPTDMNGAPVYNALLYDDIRAIEIAYSVRDQIGSSLIGYELIPKILWFRTYLPDVWRKTRRIFSTHNYIVYRLTGAYCLDGLTASSFGTIFDQDKFTWNAAQLSAFDIPPDLLPTVCSPRTIVGHITTEASLATGLKSGTPVIAGTGDTFVSMLSAGAYLPQDTLIYYGSVGVAAQLTKPASYLMSSENYSEGLGVTWLTFLPSFGKQVEQYAKYFQAMLRNEGIDSASEVYRILDKSASRIQPDSSNLVFLNNIFPQGNLFTVNPKAALLNLSLDTTPPQIYCAMLEAFGYEVREALQHVDARSPNRLFAGGGGARSKLWRQIVTNIVQWPQLYRQESLGAYGGALLAGYAVGELSFESVLNEQRDRFELVEPNKDQSAIYDQKFSFYRKLRDVLIQHEIPN